MKSVCRSWMMGTSVAILGAFAAATAGANPGAPDPYAGVEGNYASPAGYGVATPAPYGNKGEAPTTAPAQEVPGQEVPGQESPGQVAPAPACAPTPGPVPCPGPAVAAPIGHTFRCEVEIDPGDNDFYIEVQAANRRDAKALAIQACVAQFGNGGPATFCFPHSGSYIHCKD